MNNIIRLYTYLFIFEILVIVDSGVMDQNSFIGVPIGEYRLIFKSIIKCDVSQSLGNKINQNLYFVKPTTNTTILKGNMSFEIPLDDSLTFHINLAVKDSIYGWKDNAHVMVAQKACTTMKTFMGDQWSKFLNSFGIRNHNCPIKPGVYVSTADGYVLSSIQTMSKLPKTFFYGTYKCRVSFKDRKNVEHGCIIQIIEVLRP